VAFYKIKDDRKIEVRLASPADHQQIRDIEGRCYGHDRHIPVEDYFMVARERHFMLLVAEIDEMVVGFMLLYMKRPSVEIEAIAVHPEWQRLGIGRSFIEHADRHAVARNMNLIIHTCGRWIEVQMLFVSQGLERVDSYAVTTATGKQDRWYTYGKA